MTRNEALKEVETRLDAIEDSDTNNVGYPLFHVRDDNEGTIQVTFNDPRVGDFEIEYDSHDTEVSEHEVP